MKPHNAFSPQHVIIKGQDTLPVEGFLQKLPTAHYVLEDLTDVGI